MTESNIIPQKKFLQLSELGSWSDVLSYLERFTK